jgi:hypothetical protein
LLPRRTESSAKDRLEALASTVETADKVLMRGGSIATVILRALVSAPGEN